MFGLSALLGGWKLYAAIALVAVIGGLSLAVAYYRNSAQRAEAEAALASDQRDRAVEAVKVAQKSIEAISAAKIALDIALVERDRRAKELEATKRKLQNEISEIKRSLPIEDQSCLDRSLPPAILERLRQ